MLPDYNTNPELTQRSPEQANTGCFCACCLVHFTQFLSAWQDFHWKRHLLNSTAPGEDLVVVSSLRWTPTRGHLQVHSPQASCFNQTSEMSSNSFCLWLTWLVPMENERERLAGILLPAESWEEQAVAMRQQHAVGLHRLPGSALVLQQPLTIPTALQAGIYHRRYRWMWRDKLQKGESLSSITRFSSTSTSNLRTYCSYTLHKSHLPNKWRVF